MRSASELWWSLVESAEDILQEIAISFPKQHDMSCDCRRDRVTPDATRLDKGQKILLDAGGFESASVDALVIGRKTYDFVLTMPAWPYGGKRCVVMTHHAVAGEHGERGTIRAELPINSEPLSSVSTAAISLP